MHLLPRHPFSLRIPRTVGLGLTVAGLCAFSAAVTRPAMAQNLTYTLSGVTFSDGAVATGSFIFNPATQSFGDFSIATTSGAADSVPGGVYALPDTSTFSAGVGGIATGVGYFEFDNSSAGRKLGLATGTDASSPGVVPLALLPIGFASSEENAGSSTRTITAGFLDIAAPAAVPEASPAVCLGLLLVLGAGGVAATKRRAKTAASSLVT